MSDERLTDNRLSDAEREVLDRVYIATQRLGGEYGAIERIWRAARDYYTRSKSVPRVPTQAMIEAGLAYFIGTHKNDFTSAEHWQRMYDAAPRSAESMNDTVGPFPTAEAMIASLDGPPSGAQGELEQRLRDLAAAWRKPYKPGEVITGTVSCADHPAVYIEAADALAAKDRRIAELTGLLADIRDGILFERGEIYAATRAALREQR